MLAQYMLSCVCPSVSLSVTRRHCTKTAKCRITQTTPYDSAGTLVFGAKDFGEILTRVTPNGGAKKRWARLQSASFDFLTNILLYLRNGASYYGMLIGTRMCSIE